MSAKPAPVGRDGLLARLAEYTALGTLVLMQFVDLRIGVHGRPEVVSAFLVGFGVLSVLCLALFLRPARLTTAGRVALGCGVALFCWAIASAATTPAPRLFLPAVQVPRLERVVPQVTGLVTMLSAWGLAIAVRSRPGFLRRAALVITLTTVPAAARTMMARDSVRVATALGGSSTLHVALLLCVGVLLAAVIENRRSIVDWLGLGIGVVGILLISSRAGLLCLACLVALVGLALAARGRARLAASVMAVLAALTGVLVALVPAARRLLVLGDYGRQANLGTAWQAWSQNAHSMLWGVGSGRMWPWYTFEVGHAEIPWKGIIKTGFGRGLTNPHSVPLGVLTELGILALVLLLVVLCLPVVALWRRWRRADDARALVRLLPLAAVVASLPALLLDHYLFKNFAISFWWWLVYATTWLARPAAPRVIPDGGVPPRR